MGTLSTLVSGEFKALIRKAARELVRSAAARLSDEIGPIYLEEWLANLLDDRAELSQLWFGFQCHIALRKLGPLRKRERSKLISLVFPFLGRTSEISASAFIILLVLPLLLVPTFFLVIFDVHGSKFVRRTVYRKTRSSTNLYQFRTEYDNFQSNRIARFLKISRIARLPELISVANGQIGLVGDPPVNFDEPIENLSPDYRPGLIPLGPDNKVSTAFIDAGRRLLNELKRGNSPHTPP